MFANQWEAGYTQMRTLYSNNNGSTWELISPPTGEECSNCTLHFFSYDYFTEDLAMYQTRYDSNLLLANGMVGIFNENQMSLANLYMSEDLGITWRRLMNGPKITTSLDNVDWQFVAEWSTIATNNLLYTSDRGTTWQTCQFNNDTSKVHYVQYMESAFSDDPDTIFIITEKPDLTYSIFYVRFDTRVIPPCNFPTDFFLAIQSPCVNGERNLTYTKILDRFCNADGIETFITESCMGPPPPPAGPKSSETDSLPLGLVGTILVGIIIPLIIIAVIIGVVCYFQRKEQPEGNF